MSYDLNLLEGAPNGRIVRIGWDGPLDSFFLQVIDEPDDRTQENGDEFTQIIWKGTSPFEFPNPDDLVDIARQYAVIPDDLVDRLNTDKRDSSSAFAGRVGTHLIGESALRAVVNPEQATQIFAALEDTPRD
ncbi:hypothetical protein [Streptomyces vinaceus]|uniref:hypothetical protein n=1 Tax=Streptomyces vinaceus TaxID=1960 RepID=UPI00369C2B80